MRADGGWLHRSLAGATRQPSVVISTAGSGLGLFQYPPIRSDERTSGVSATGADEAVEGRSLLCLALAAPRLPTRSRSAHRGGIASVAFHVAVISVLISAATLSRSTNRPVLNPALTSQSNCRGSCSCCNPVPAGVAAVAATSNHVNHRRRKRSDVTGSPYRLPGALTCGNHRKWRLRCTRYCSTRSRWHRGRR